MNDIKKEFFPILFSPELFAKKDQVFKDKIQEKITQLTEYLGKKDFLVGKLSYADFIFYEMLSAYQYLFPACITPTLATYIKRFESLPGIKEYIAHPTIDLRYFFFKFT